MLLTKQTSTWHSFLPLQPGRKKKAFIDKKNAVTFHLVHRSQKDPLQADEDAPQRVLLPSARKAPVSNIFSLVFLGFVFQEQLYFNETTQNTTCRCVFSTIFQKAADIRKEEQRKFGVFFDDDYDYMQHLKDVDELNEVEPIASLSLQRNAASTKVLN